VIKITDVEDVQQALDALVNGDHQAAADRFTHDVVVTGVGGYLRGRITGLLAVLDRFARMSRLTGGTYGTEVEAVYTDQTTQLVVVTRHWASIHGEQVHGTQALLVTVAGGRIRAISAFSRPGPASGIWD
jgi:ketosteroid isomerase-like protein